MDKIKNFSVVFPGQASQYIGMGKEFIENIPGCADIIKKGEDITSIPLMEKIMQGPMEELTRTLICQPAVFAINMVCWYALTNKGLYPNSVAGHSLGEYSALVASKTISLEEGFYLVKRRAEIMDELSGRVDGGLLAIIGLSIEELENILNTFDGISIANINSYRQIVVGGNKETLKNFYSFLRERKIKSVMLNVSGPFHTLYMKEASYYLADEIEKVHFKNPEIPVYLNYSGEKNVDKEEIKKGLIYQIYSPVRWVTTIENIVKDEKDVVFVEVGPKTVLKRLIEEIIPTLKVFNVEDRASLDSTLKGLRI
ncbi:MAG: ACP S-malonyltransferase [Candidatus Ratteibacteria bacterium]|nr:ACP S-malonyltransferase [Candidatus Ratteibacteria bacterium]